MNPDKSGMAEAFYNKHYGNIYIGVMQCPCCSSKKNRCVGGSLFFGTHFLSVAFSDSSMRLEEQDDENCGFQVTMECQECELEWEFFYHQNVSEDKVEVNLLLA